jgi:hypothetical protein
MNECPTGTAKVGRLISRGRSWYAMSTNIQKYYTVCMTFFAVSVADVLICSFGVGSVGLTLTRSHTVILLDR